MEKQKVTQTQKIMLGILAILFLFVLYKYFYSPLKVKISKAKHSLTKRQNELKSLQRKIANIEELREEFQLMQQQLKKIETLLPLERELPKIIRTITTVGREYGIDITTFRPQRKKTQPYYDIYAYRINFTTNYHNLALFLSKIGKLKRIINEEDLSINASTTRKGSTVSTSFLIDVYTLKE